MLVLVDEALFGVDKEASHLGSELLNLDLTLFFASLNHLIDFVHLLLIPLYFLLIVVASILEKQT